MTFGKKLTESISEFMDRKQTEKKMITPQKQSTRNKQRLSNAQKRPIKNISKSDDEDSDDEKLNYPNYDYDSPKNVH